MINKKSVWFLTLFSLILVLSVYYVTMPSELLLNSKNNKSTVSKTEKKDTTKATIKTEESELLTSLRVEANEVYNNELEKLKGVMTNKNATSAEKNSAFEKMKTINNLRGKEEELEKLILEQYKFNSCVIINGSDIKVTVSSKEHDTKKANDIMRLIQTKFQTKMYITVQFQK